MQSITELNLPRSSYVQTKSIDMPNNRNLSLKLLYLCEKVNRHISTIIYI